MGIEIHSAKDAINLAISPCPNDTFIFGAWINGKIPTDTEPVPSVSYLDIEALNRAAIDREFDVIKISAAITHLITEDYVIFNCGGAMGKANGPLLVSDKAITAEEIPTDSKILLPGQHTTAHFLFRSAFPLLENKEFRLFSTIEDSILAGESHFGVIIHEGRFTYAKKGLHMVADLGALWTNKTGLPIPLGLIAGKRSLGHERLSEIEAVIRASLTYQEENPHKLNHYILDHASEMEPEVIEKHIKLYVNEYSHDIKDMGRQAIVELMGFFGKENLDIEHIFLI